MRGLDGISGITEDSEVTVDVQVPGPGKYVLVLEYASTDNKYVNYASTRFSFLAKNRQQKKFFKAFLSNPPEKFDPLHLREKDRTTTVRQLDVGVKANYRF